MTTDTFRLDDATRTSLETAAAAMAAAAMHGAANVGAAESALDSAIIAVGEAYGGEFAERYAETRKGVKYRDGFTFTRRGANDTGAFERADFEAIGAAVKPVLDVVFERIHAECGGDAALAAITPKTKGNPDWQKAADVRAVGADRISRRFAFHGMPLLAFSVSMKAADAEGFAGRCNVRVRKAEKAKRDPISAAVSWIRNAGDAEGFDPESAAARLVEAMLGAGIDGKVIRDAVSEVARRRETAAKLAATLKIDPAELAKLIS